RNRHHGVKQVPTGHQFDRIGNDLPTDQGGFHALSTHGDAVRNCDGIVLNRRTTGGADASLHMLGQIAGIERTGHYLDPGMRHPDQGPRQVFVGETNRLEHGTSWRAVRTIGDVMTVVFQGIGHGCVSPVGKNSSALQLRPAPYGTIWGAFSSMKGNVWCSLSFVLPVYAGCGALPYV